MFTGCTGGNDLLLLLLLLFLSSGGAVAVFRGVSDAVVVGGCE